MGWLEDVAGPNFAPAVLWTLLALVVLVIVLIILRLVRSMTFGTFVAGGRNRKTRLAVMDATAVDSQRRLVLVRRDDVEHLVLIGGPTDVVVERDIRLHSPARRPAATAETMHDAQARMRAEQRRPPASAARPDQPAYRSAPMPGNPGVPARPAPKRPPTAAPAAADQAVSTVRPQQQKPGDSAPPAPRLKPLDTGKAQATASGEGNKDNKPLEMSLEDEMNRLLGELSTKK